MQLFIWQRYGCLANKNCGSLKNGEIYNVGGEEVISHSEVAYVLSKLCKNNPDEVFIGKSGVLDRKNDFFPDLSLIKSSLAHIQAYNMSLSLERLIQWHSKKHT